VKHEVYTLPFVFRTLRWRRAHSAQRQRNPGLKHNSRVCAEGTLKVNTPAFDYQKALKG
jgi:hypothetical protein